MIKREIQEKIIQDPLLQHLLGLQCIIWLGLELKRKLMDQEAFRFNLLTNFIRQVQKILLIIHLISRRYDI